MKKKTNEKKLDVVFILDKSGSMSGSEDHTIGSFNEYLEKEKKNSFETKITTVLFSDKHYSLYERKPVKEVHPLTHEEYFVGGCTALYDAIGDTITSIDQKTKGKVLFIIITDGYENASKEYTRDQVRHMIQTHKNYEFIYIGADIDSYATGGDIGIKRDNIANYKKDRKGTSLLFRSVQNVECAMMGEQEVSGAWKQELENYVNENKKSS